MKILNTNKHFNSIKILWQLLLVAFIVSLIPIVTVSFYSHPNYDDYNFSANLHQCIKSGGSIFEALDIIFQEIKDCYFNWQGNFSAIFMFQLQPGIISQNAYFINTLLMLSVLIFGEYSLFNRLYKSFFKDKKDEMLLVFFLITIIKIQLVPYPFDSFYWYNGAVYYTFFYGITLMLLSLMIELLTTSDRKIDFKLICTALLAFFVSGSSFTNTLPTLIILITICIYAFISNKNSRYKILFISIIFLIGFIIAFVAPGNSARQSFFEKTGAINSVFLSLKHAFSWLLTWIKNPCNLLVWIFLCPAIYSLAKSSKFKFKHPIIFIIFAFGLFSCQWTPPLYAMGGISGGRQLNVFFYSHYWFMLSILFYIFGYLSRKSSSVIPARSFSFIKTKAIAVFLVFAILFIIVARGQGMLSLVTTKSIVNGEVQEYHTEMNSMISQLEVEPQEVVYVDRIKTVPSFFGEPDIQGHSIYWVNTAYARYFGHGAVIAK